MTMSDNIQKMSESEMLSTVKPVIRTGGITLGGITGSYTGAVGGAGLGFAIAGPIGGVIGFSVGLTGGGGLGVVVGNKICKAINQSL